MQHVNVKIFAEPRAEFDPNDVIAVFHRWIQQGDLPELLIDVADYSHVPAGPGVVLIAHEAAYSLDNMRNRLGLLYDRKAATDLGPRDSLREAYERALAACRRLEKEPELQGQLKFDTDEVEVIWNDRLLHPNTDESWKQVQPDTTAFFDGLFGAGTYTLERAADPRERLRVNARKM